MRVHHQTPLPAPNPPNQLLFDIKGIVLCCVVVLLVCEIKHENVV